ncbi:MAG: DUF2752 domain-containing protein [Propionibacteriaceae bacterium]
MTDYQDARHRVGGDAVRPVVPASAPFEVRRALLGLGAFGAVGVSVSTIYATTGVGLPCPLRTLTGWDCPLCGGTRLGSALLHGDVEAAFVANPLVLIGLGVLVVLGGLWIVEAIGGPRFRPPARVQTVSRRLSPTTWTALALGLGLGYAVARNLWFPV